MDVKKETIRSYDKSVESYAKNVSQLHPSKEGNFFLSLMPKKARILDVGCGTGRDAKVFAKKRYKVVGIDLSKQMIAKAKKDVENAEFRVMDISNIKFQKSFFGGVWMNASLLHVGKKEVPAVLKRLHFILKEQGVLFIRVKKGKGEHFLPDKRYGGLMKFLSLFSKKELERMVNQANFVIVRSSIEKPKSSYGSHDWVTLFCKKM